MSTSASHPPHALQDLHARVRDAQRRRLLRPFHEQVTLFSAMNASMFAFNSGPRSARVVIPHPRPRSPRVRPSRRPPRASPRAFASHARAHRHRPHRHRPHRPSSVRPFVRRRVCRLASARADTGPHTPRAAGVSAARVVHIIPYSDPCRTHRRETTTDINAHRASTDHRPNAPRNTMTDHTDRTHGDTRAIDSTRLDSTRLDSTRIDRIDRGRASIDSIFIDRIDRSNACMEWHEMILWMLDRVVVGVDLDDGTRRTIERARRGRARTRGSSFDARRSFVGDMSARATASTSARTATWTSRRRHRHRRGMMMAIVVVSTVDGNAMVVARACVWVRANGARGRRRCPEGRWRIETSSEARARRPRRRGRRRAERASIGERVRGSRRGDGG